MPIVYPDYHQNGSGADYELFVERDRLDGMQQVPGLPIAITADQNWLDIIFLIK